jgi:TonB family protein
METYWIYLLKANALLLLGYLLYKVLLTGQTHFATNRIMLLLVSLSAVLIPLINPFGSDAAAPLLMIELPELAIVPNNSAPENGFNTVDGIIGFFMCISAFIFLRLAFRIIHLLQIEKGYRLEHYWIIPSDQLETSSFFNRIFLKNNMDDATREIALAHEKVHADQWHTLDVIWFELLTVFFWMNPAIWLLKKELRDNHEFIADKISRQQFGNSKYINALLNNTFQSQAIHFLPMFSNTQTLKNRITMMKSNQPVAKLRYVLFLPMMAAISIAAACTQKTDLKEIATNESEKVQEQEILSIADQMPEFPGGTTALFEYLSQNIVYPETAREENASGKVFVKFVIDVNGKVTQAEVIRGVHPDLDNEALRVVNTMPNWQPGMHEGKLVNVVFNLPINFQLQ